MLVRPTIDEVLALRGTVPQQFTRAQAAMALEASGLVASLLPWWPLMCGYAWKQEVVARCPLLSGNEQPLCEDTGLERQAFQPGVEYRLHRASIPAALWACFAVARSGGDLHYYRAGRVPVGGLFAIPLDTARSIGMNPWAVYDALRYVRTVVEGTVVAWQTRAVPGPKVEQLEDLVAAALFQYLAGSLAATTIFGALEHSGVSADSILRYVLGPGVDWSSGAFAGVGQRWVQTAAQRVVDIMAATMLVEGWWWASKIGWHADAPSGPFDAVPRPPTDAYAFAYPTAALADAAGAAQSSVVMYPGREGARPPALRSYLDRLQVLYPMEYGDEASLRARGLDAYQAHHVTIAGHYLVRQSVLAATVPGYLLSTEPQQPREEQEVLPTPRRTRVPVLAWIALGVASAAAAGAAAYTWWKRRRR